MNWKDITTYSKGEECIPSWWSIKLGVFILKVGNKHIYHKDTPKWLMIFDHGHEILGNENVLTEKQAKVKALEIASDRLARASSKAGDALIITREGN